MGVVDTIMVGPLGPSAIGAVGIGNAIFDVSGVFGFGLLLGLDPLISQAFGAGRREECDRWLWQGVWLALIAGALLMLLVEATIPVMRIAGVQPGVLELTIPYVRALNWSLPFLLLSTAFRRYLQSLNRVGIIMFTLLSANLVNAAGNYVLIGRFGVEGSGWATLGARVYMMAVMAGYAFAIERDLLRHIRRPNLTSLRTLFALGGPAAGQIVLEVGVFATATILAGKLAPEALAAHHIALQIAGTTFMIPLGISSAGAVAVGQEIGRGDPAAAKRAGWITIAFGVTVMTCAALILFAMPRAIVQIFTSNAGVLEVAVPLLFVAALFQIFDGTQVTATGVLRGAGDTRTPMFANLVAHWALGLPAGYSLCFVLGWGVAGLWTGLSAGLIAVGIVLLVCWWRLRL